MPDQARSEEDARVRGYLVSQAERYDVLALWPRVIADRGAFLLALDRVTEEQARWRPSLAAGGGAGEGEVWSILEVAQHALVWSRSVTAIVESLAAGRPAEAPPPGQLDPAVAATLEQARSALTAAAVHFAALPERLPVAADLAATAEHPQFGPLNYRAWFLFSRLHDGDHLRQVEVLKAAEGYPS